jgi:DNA-binding beta-propeller fold protein YncE
MVTMFDLKTLAVIKKIKVDSGGLDGIMYDEPDDKIILTNHSQPTGTLTAIDPASGAIVATVELEDNGPEGAAADGKGHIFVNNEGKSTIQEIDVKTWKAVASWPLAPCDGPTGIAYDKASDRIFSGCPKNSVVVNPATGKVVATINNGSRVDALGWDPGRKLVFIPNGGEGNVTVAHQDSSDTYTVVATVPTFAGAKTIAVDPTSHNAYLFQPERGPAPAPAAGATPPAGAPAGRGRGPQGPIVASWFIVIHS